MPSDAPLTPVELKALRDRLDEIDSGIIDLIAERLAVVKSIGDHKLKTGAPLRHYEREREVIDRGVNRAESHGISQRLAREVLETLIHHSIGDQETNQLAQSEHGLGKRALVIGGLGRMGVWMARFLDTAGYDVDVADPVKAESQFQVVDDWELRSEDAAHALAWAAQLHEIGLAVNYTGHHKHGAYLVASSDLPGFARDEQALVAAAEQVVALAAAREGEGFRVEFSALDDGRA